MIAARSNTCRDFTMYSFLLLPFTNHTHSPLPLSHSPPLDPAEWFNHHLSVTTTASTIEHFHRFHYLFSPPNFLVAIDHPHSPFSLSLPPRASLNYTHRWSATTLRPLCWLPTYLNCVCFLFLPPLLLFPPPFLWFLSPFGFQFFLFFVLLFFLFFALLNFGVLEVRKLHRRVGNHNGPTDRVVNAIRTNPQGRVFDYRHTRNVLSLKKKVISYPGGEL